MKRNSRTGSRLFFIEFLIVLFFFLIISTVCLRLFAQAHSVTQHSEALSHAQVLASSVAAVIEEGKDAAPIAADDEMAGLVEGAATITSDNAVSGLVESAATIAADNEAAGLVESAATITSDNAVTGLVENAASYFPDASVTENGFFITYDQNFNPCPAKKAFYTLAVTMKLEDRKISADIVIEAYDHSVLYKLPVSFSVPLTRGEVLQ